ncbi:glycosyltransferase [Thiohalocapsa marina]|nr:glycosyltransferase [Thiohalocapsa marina]
MQIFVLGMHRSGTSALTRIINMMGASLGPAHLVGGPAADNPKGFWERTDVSGLNDDLLRELDCRWDDIAHLSPQDFDRLWPEPLLDRLQQVLFQLDTHRPWVLKDPRLCLTLPVWRRHLEVPVCILMHRSPIEVAQSLSARNGFSLTHGIALWEQYTLSALQGSAGLPRRVLSYAHLLERPMETVGELYEFLREAEVGGLRLPSEREVAAFLDNGLRHHETTVESMDGYLNLAQQRLALAMADGSALSWTEVPQPSAGAVETLALIRSQRVNAEQVHASLQRLQADLVDAHAELERSVQAAEQVASQDREIAALGTDLTTVQRRAGELQERLDASLVEIDAKDTQIAALGTDLTTVQRRSEALAQQVDHTLADNASKTALAEQLAQETMLLGRWLDGIDSSFRAAMGSWRWRLGDSAVRSVERLMRRSKPALATDHIEAVLAEFRRWRQDGGAWGRVWKIQLRPPVGANLGSVPVQTPRSSASASATPLTPRLPHAAEGKPDVLIFPIIDWHFRIQRPQHIARCLGELGHRVFYFTTTPLPETEQAGYEILENPATNVYLCRLTHRGAAVSIYDRPMDEAVRDAMLSSLQRLQAEWMLHCPVSVVHLPFWGPLAAAIPGGPVIYDCMDYHAGFSTHTAQMQREEDRLFQLADAVITTSDWLSKRIAHKAPTNVLIRNGAEVQRFKEAAAANNTSPGSRPVVGYVGAIAEWFDTALVAAAADAYPDWDFVLVGATHGCDTRPLEKRPNVQLLGEQPYDSIPARVAAFDVCIIPFQLTELIQATNPVKAYEYLSARKPVVATNLPELRPLTDLVHVTDSHEAFITALATAMDEHDDAILRTNRQAWATDQDWLGRARQFETVMSAQLPKASVIVLTYNNLDYTKACLESLEQFTDYPDWELIIVDNASTDGTPAFLQDYAGGRSHVRLILNDDNLGFAGGNNCGLRVAKGDYVVLLNNDTYVTQGWLYGLIRHLAKDPKLGLVGPVTNNIGNEAKIDIHYSNMSEMAVAARAYTAAHARHLIPNDVVAFFCVAWRRSLLEEVGLLDEQFELGFFEDDDYCRRVREAGYGVAIAEDVFIHHHLSASFGTLPDEARKRLFDDNRARYEAKWGEGWTQHVYRDK